MSGIPDADLQRHLQSLACAKYKILKKHPPSREVSTSDSFSFNSGFTSPLLRIKIATLASKVESNEERKETQDRIEEERKQQADVSGRHPRLNLTHESQACIVRVMKDRKVMGHNELINEATRQLARRFKPNPAMIKRRIEALIEVGPVSSHEVRSTDGVRSASTWRDETIGSLITTWYGFFSHEPGRVSDSDQRLKRTVSTNY